jgi:hypothetical protein
MSVIEILRQLHDWRSSSACGKLAPMKAPSAILIKKAPATVKCPSCSQTFSRESYGGDMAARLSQVEVEYQKHFKDKHSSEDTIKSAARL